MAVVRRAVAVTVAVAVAVAVAVTVAGAVAVTVSGGHRGRTVFGIPVRTPLPPVIPPP